MMEDGDDYYILELARNAFGPAWMKLNEQGGIRNEGVTPLSSSQTHTSAAGSFNGSSRDDLTKKSIGSNSNSPSLYTSTLSSTSSGIPGKSPRSPSTSDDIRAGFLSAVANILPDVAPSIGPSSLPTIAGKVVDDILSGDASFDAVPPKSEVLSLVQARMGIIKSLIKEGRKPQVAHASASAAGSAPSTLGMVPTLEEVKANLRHRIPIMLPELLPELVRCMKCGNVSLFIHHYAFKRPSLLSKSGYFHILMLWEDNVDLRNT